MHFIWCMLGCWNTLPCRVTCDVKSVLILAHHSSSVPLQFSRAPTLGQTHFLAKHSQIFFMADVPIWDLDLKLQFYFILLEGAFGAIHKTTACDGTSAPYCLVVSRHGKNINI